MRVGDLMMLIDRQTPFDGAAAWDPVGLQIGGPNREANRIGVCHEVTNEVIDQAIAVGIDALVSYHPLLFTPTTSLIDGPGANGRALRLASAGVSVIVVHTALDVARPGTGDALLAALGCVTEDVFAEGLDVGSPPIGRIASLKRAMSVMELTAHVSTMLDVTVRVAPSPTPIGTIAVVPGSGGSFIARAAELVDALVTGDVSHHRAREATELGLTVIDAGHTATERPGVEAMYAALRTDVADVTMIACDPSPWEVEWNS